MITRVRKVIPKMTVSLISTRQMNTSSLQVASMSTIYKGYSRAKSKSISCQALSAGSAVSSARTSLATGFPSCSPTTTSSWSPSRTWTWSSASAWASKTSTWSGVSRMASFRRWIAGAISWLGRSSAVRCYTARYRRRMHQTLRWSSMRSIGLTVMISHTRRTSII